MDSIEEVSIDRLYVAFRRAETALGGEAEIDSSLFQVEFSHQLSLIVTETILAAMNSEGAIEVRRVDKRGHRRWSMTRTPVTA